MMEWQIGLDRIGWIVLAREVADWLIGFAVDGVAEGGRQSKSGTNRISIRSARRRRNIGLHCIGPDWNWMVHVMWRDVGDGANPAGENQCPSPGFDPIGLDPTRPQSARLLANRSWDICDR